MPSITVSWYLLQNLGNLKITTFRPLNRQAQEMFNVAHSITVLDFFLVLRNNKSDMNCSK